MRPLMNVTKDRHGTYYAIKKVPAHLQEAVARVLNRGKAQQTWLKRSLRTKDVEQANRIAKPILIEFDRILAQAESLQAERPLRSELSAREIEQISHISTPTNSLPTKMNAVKAVRRNCSKRLSNS
jgi:dTDP-4-dehydrorhamnose reductase